MILIFKAEAVDMVASGTAPIIPQSTEGASFEPSVRKKILQKVCTYFILVG